MTLFDCRPHRLDDPRLIEAAVRALRDEGYDRLDIEEALIRTAPIDLDLLAQCLARVLLTGEDLSSQGYRRDAVRADVRASATASRQRDGAGRTRQAA